MENAPVAAATQAVSRRKGRNAEPGGPTRGRRSRPVRGHALGCARRPKARLERLRSGRFSLSCPQPASSPCAGPRRASEVGVAFVRLLPASSPPRHGAPHAGKSASSLGRPEKSVPTPLRAPLRPQALKPIRGARPRGADAEGGWGRGRSFQVPRREAGWRGCARTPTRPGLRRRGLASSARARCASPTPAGIPSPARGAVCSGPEPSRASRRMCPPSGRPALPKPSPHSL